MSEIGFVGLGAMGAAIAGRLIDLGGNEVHGTNRTRAKAGPLISRGLLWSDTPREAAAVADVVISMVADDAALLAVADGPDGILAGIRPGSLYIDMSTVSPQARPSTTSSSMKLVATMVMAASPARPAASGR